MKETTINTHSIRTARRLGEYSGDTVARLSGIDKFRLSRLERGHAKPRPGELARIADAIARLNSAKQAAVKHLIANGMPPEIVSGRHGPRMR